MSEQMRLEETHTFYLFLRGHTSFHNLLSKIYQRFCSKKFSNGKKAQSSKNEKAYKKINGLQTF